MLPEYEHLFSINTDFIVGHFGNVFLKKAHKRGLTKEESLEANKVLSEVLYSTNVANLIKKGCFSDVTDLALGNTHMITSDKADVNRCIMGNRAGLILVRPEMLHAYKLVEGFLLEKGFKVELSLEKKVDFNHYWAIYKDSLTDPNSSMDFPTRTLIYTSGYCRLIVFTDPENRYNAKMMDEFCRLFKGKEGIIREGTIRGDIVLKELIRIGVGDRSNKELEFALDPIGMYRHIVDGNIPSDNIHGKCDYPFLHYVGGGVHIPNEDETLLNFKILLNGSDNITF